MFGIKMSSLLTAALAAAVLGSVAFTTSTAEAARGGKGQSAPVPSTIAIDSADPHLGDRVTFTYSTSVGGQEVRIQVPCYQHGVAWAADQAADTAFVLGGAASAWATNGGSASCVAYLYQRNIVDGTLARTSFTAGGAR